MFKLRQVSKKKDASAVPQRSAKKTVGKKAASERLAREAASKKRVPKAAEKPASKHVGKALPKPKSKGAATTQRRDLVLRKRASTPMQDLGIGAQSVEPAKDALNSTAVVAGKAAVDKKATDVVVMDVREVSGLCDEMVICTARSVTHLNAVADAIEEAMRKIGERVIHRDGLAGSEPDWVLLDYGDMMVHVFRQEARESYGLEVYYGQARLVAKWKND